MLVWKFCMAIWNCLICSTPVCIIRAKSVLMICSTAVAGGVLNGHLDADFVFAIKCADCGRMFRTPAELPLLEVDADSYGGVYHVSDGSWPDEPVVEDGTPWIPARQKLPWPLRDRGDLPCEQCRGEPLHARSSHGPRPDGKGGYLPEDPLTEKDLATYEGTPIEDGDE